MNKCEKIYKNGEIRKLEAQDKEIILNRNSNMADKALRVLAVSYLDTEELPKTLDAENLEQKLIFARINTE